MKINHVVMIISIVLLFLVSGKTYAAELSTDETTANDVEMSNSEEMTQSATSS